MTDAEVACLLSHLFAIYTASTYSGQYFLILEDDVTFKNMKHIINLKNIINQCPKNFDILMLNKLDTTELESLYTIKKKIIFGTQSYIISRSGIEKILRTFDFNCNKFTFYTKHIMPSDWFIYDKCDIVYVYKYNIIPENILDSTIHEDHLILHHECNNYNDKILKKNIGKFMYINEINIYNIV